MQPGRAQFTERIITKKRFDAEISQGNCYTGVFARMLGPQRAVS